LSKQHALEAANKGLVDAFIDYVQFLKNNSIVVSPDCYEIADGLRAEGKLPKKYSIVGKIDWGDQ
jgi:hypothetical protein